MNLNDKFAIPIIFEILLKRALAVNHFVVFRFQQYSFFPEIFILVITSFSQQAQHLGFPEAISHKGFDVSQ